ncbi:MAG: hypothetical protein OEW08_04190 [Gammaproteobacteria bacterium]|nr:hypothetical protein [Gammaproteobacteria bacterium]
MIAVDGALADEWLDKGHLKYFYNKAWYDAPSAGVLPTGKVPEIHQFNARYDGTGRWDAWRAEAHYALQIRAAEQPAFSKTPPAVDQTQVANLAQWLIHEPRTQALHRLDRLNIGYTAAHWTARFGRQAVSWGNGINFHPMDIFNPFAPNAIDKDYKNGDDLAYMQWLFEDGADAQLIAVPRRKIATHTLSAEQSSLAIKYRRSTALGDIDLLVSRHYAEYLTGIGWAKSVAGAIIRADATITRLTDQKTALTGVINADYSWNWFGYNIYGYTEYYYQSLGTTYPSSGLDSALRARITRGEIFVTGKHYVDVGMMIELAALVHLTPALVFNVADGSYSLPCNISYEPRQNWLLVAGATLNQGNSNTEFGGNSIATPKHQAYLHVARYF